MHFCGTHNCAIWWSGGALVSKCSPWRGALSWMIVIGSSLHIPREDAFWLAYVSHWLSFHSRQFFLELLDPPWLPWSSNVFCGFFCCCC
jgi:hypothetical protein